MNILVYLGANEGNKKIYKDAALEIGQWIIDSNHNLVYGGNAKGLMGILARKVKESPAKVIGIMPEFLMEIEERFLECDEFITTITMNERKAKMLNLADACIALPGGAGTMEEITEAYSLFKVGQHDSPCIFYNKEGYYDSMAKMYDKMVEEGFLDQKDRDYLLFSEDLEEIESFIRKCKDRGTDD